MSLGEKLLKYRKGKNLSQEEVANQLNVSRQTISKWETDQSTPDFDKIIPICKLYEITSDELLSNEEIKKENKNLEKNNEQNIVKKAKGIGLGVLLYFVAIAWIMITIPVLNINPIVASAIFLLICGFGTYIIIYTSIVYKNKKNKEEEKDKLFKQIEDIVSSIFLIIYLVISFVTSAWHITWIIWIIYALVVEIIKLIISLRRGDLNEK